MAQADQQTLAEDPPRRLAQLLLAKFALTPPVDVEALLRRYADVETVRLPVEGDAVVVRTPGARPKVLLAADAEHERRRRFTIAHEIGHLVIPWQPGTLVCHTASSYAFDDFLVQNYEQEANVFASELLLPSQWAKQRLLNSTAGDLARLVRTIANEAEVSAPTAVLGLGRLCETRVLLLLVDSASGAVRYTSGGGPGLHVPSVWTADTKAQAIRAGCVVSSAAWGSQMIWSIEVRGDAPALVRPTRPARTIRDSILDDIGIQGNARIAFMRRLSGVVGSANNHAYSSEDLRRTLGGAFLGRQGDGFEAFLAHPDFAEFLDATALELGERQRPARSHRK